MKPLNKKDLKFYGTGTTFATVVHHGIGPEARREIIDKLINLFISLEGIIR